MLFDIQPVIGGLAMGCVYGLVALGFVFIYKATEAVNFAQGEFMMVGAFTALTLIALGVPLVIVVVLTAAALFLMGMLLDRVLLRQVIGESHFSVIMLTVGLALIIRGVVPMVPGWGTQTHALKTFYSGEVVRILGIPVSAEHLAIFAITALLCGAFFLFFRYTRLGIAVQASSQNQVAAYLMGIPVKRLNSIVWGAAAAAAAVAGILLAPLTFVYSGMALIGLKAFPAAVLGGLTSIPGALIGGLLIGLVEALAGFYLPEGVKDVAPYVVLLLVLFVRPEGLFADPQGKRV